MNWYITNVGYSSTATLREYDWLLWVQHIYCDALAKALQAFIDVFEHCPNCGCHVSGHHPVGCEGAGGNCGCRYTREQVEDLLAQDGAAALLKFHSPFGQGIKPWTA